MASLFAKAMRDGARCLCELCDGEGFVGMGQTPVLQLRVGGTPCTCGDGWMRIYGPEAVNRAALLKELGDVMWCAAMIYTDDDGWLDEHDRRVTDTGRLAQVAHVLWSGGVGSVFRVVQRLCLDLGFTPEEVALANVEKLKSRVALGTIHGQGDER